MPQSREDSGNASSTRRHRFVRGLLVALAACSVTLHVVALFLLHQSETAAQEEAAAPLAENAIDRFAFARGLARHVASRPDVIELIVSAGTPEAYAGVLAPYVPFPYRSILVYDANGNVLARVTTGRSAEITPEETKGIDEAGIAESAVVNFDAPRRLMRQFEPVFRQGARAGFLCFELDILPEGDWFVAGNEGILIASTALSSGSGSSPAGGGQLSWPPARTWPLGDIGGDRLRIGCVLQPRASGVRIAIVASLALQLLLAAALASCFRKG